MYDQVLPLWAPPPKVHQKRKIMVTIHCLNCDADLSISAMAEAGDLITCQDCDTVFEVVAIDPVEIDFADEEEVGEDYVSLDVDTVEAGTGDASDVDPEAVWAVAWDAGEEDDLADLDEDGETDEEVDDDADDDDDDEGEDDDELDWDDDDDLDWDDDDDDDWDDDDWDDDDWDDDDD